MLLNKLTSKQKAFLLLTQRIETKILAVCEITGIAITIQAPSILGYSLEYTNPISEAKNFLQIAELPTKQLLELEPSILSGLLLAILKHYELMECPLTAAAQNLSLQSIHPSVLVELIKFYSNLSRTSQKTISILPHITLIPKDIGEYQTSSITSVLKNYRQVCADILFPVADTSELAKINKEVDAIHYTKVIGKNQKIAEAILRARRTKEATQKDLLVTGRRLIRELSQENILSPSLLNFLKLLFTKDYLLNAELSIKDRISKALLKHQNSKCLQLVKILNDGASTNIIESIFKVPEDEEIEESLEEVEEQQVKKLSIKEKIALRKAGKEIPSLREQVLEELSEVGEEPEEQEEIEELPEEENYNDFL